MYADYSQFQDFLTLLIELIAILGFGGCIAHSMLKQHLEVSKIYQEVPRPQVTEIPEQTPVTPIVEIPSIDSALPELDIDNLPLRPVRKIASMLKIKQKVNKKDQPVSWLRAQIKKALQDKPELLQKAVEIIEISQKTA